jgi:hypothetical protein
MNTGDDFLNFAVAFSYAGSSSCVNCSRIFEPDRRKVKELYVENYFMTFTGDKRLSSNCGRTQRKTGKMLRRTLEIKRMSVIR